jgi:uncharacterized protein (DUF4415 family)
MKPKRTSRRSLTDWKRVDRLKDEDIDVSDILEISPNEFARSVVREGLRPRPSKSQLTLRVDDDVLAWFRSKGSGYQSRINALLRAFMEAHKA